MTTKGTTTANIDNLYSSASCDLRCFYFPRVLPPQCAMMVPVLTNYLILSSGVDIIICLSYAGSHITTLSLPPNLYLNPYLIIAEAEME